MISASKARFFVVLFLRMEVSGVPPEADQVSGKKTENLKGDAWKPEIWCLSLGFQRF